MCSYHQLFFTGTLIGGKNGKIKSQDKILRQINISDLYIPIGNIANKTLTTQDKNYSYRKLRN